jgi:hypothetical protein
MAVARPARRPDLPDALRRHRKTSPRGSPRLATAPQHQSGAPATEYACGDIRRQSDAPYQHRRSAYDPGARVPAAPAHRQCQGQPERSCGYARRARSLRLHETRGVQRPPGPRPPPTMSESPSAPPRAGHTRPWRANRVGAPEERPPRSGLRRGAVVAPQLRETTTARRCGARQPSRATALSWTFRPPWLKRRSQSLPPTLHAATLANGQVQRRALK